jgi:hydrogenase maturation protein HypF
MAAEHGLSGEVANRTDGVSVLLRADLRTVEEFSNDVLLKQPPASKIKSLEIYPREIDEYETFIIGPSLDGSSAVTEVSPDIGVCSDCIADLRLQGARKNYPFVNCTNCGPRFTIIEALPYDRKATSMKNFRMCSSCQAEYDNILNRRYHAQPNACSDCGPSYTLNTRRRYINGISEILSNIALRIESGDTVAVKGIGGWFLMCDALNNEAVKGLRNRKNRDAKPFAVMFRDLQEADRFCYLSAPEKELLTSWRRPIVILNNKELPGLAPAVSAGLATTGVMLPYMPIHYLLFDFLKTHALVLTSGNISDEPIIINDAAAEDKLACVTESFLTYDREIVNRADDSVLRVISGRQAIIRRSRGFVPEPVDLNFNAESILAVGPELKNTFCLGRGSQAILSQHIGDLKNPATLDCFCDALESLTKLFRFNPQILACDLHPDYLSTRFAEDLSEKSKLKLFRIQHHHAHIASCMAENNLDGKVIGICFDGTGYGTDSNIWGGECFIAGLDDFIRFAHFDYIPMPGGDLAVKEPWRMAFSYIYKYMGDSFDYLSIPVFRKAGPSKLTSLKEMITGGLNSPLSSGAGRLFDAVSSLTGLCMEANFEAEAPMRLESVADPGTVSWYPFHAERTVVFSDMINAILDDIKNGINTTVISAKFHNSIARAAAELALQARKETGINTVVLSGGVFQNRFLTERIQLLLTRENFKLYTNNAVPANDGGISLGQLAVAARLSGLCV